MDLIVEVCLKFSVLGVCVFVLVVAEFHLQFPGQQATSLSHWTLHIWAVSVMCLRIEWRHHSVCRNRRHSSAGLTNLVYFSSSVDSMERIAMWHPFLSPYGCSKKILMSLVFCFFG